MPRSRQLRSTTSEAVLSRSRFARRYFVLPARPQFVTGFDLFDPSGTVLGTSAAGRATPDFLPIDFGQPESGLADDLSDAEGANPVPGAYRIAKSALKTEAEGFSAGLIDFLNDFLERSDGFYRRRAPFFEMMG